MCKIDTRLQEIATGTLKQDRQTRGLHYNEVGTLNLNSSTQTKVVRLRYAAGLTLGPEVVSYMLQIEERLSI